MFGRDWLDLNEQGAFRELTQGSLRLFHESDCVFCREVLIELDRHQGGC